MIILFLFPVALFFIYMFYLFFIWQWGINCQPFYNSESPLIMGHRGSPELITENTLPSFSHALDQGVDGLEFDIRLSKDGQIVIFHDQDLRRLGNRKEKIKTLSLTELQSIQLKKQPKQTEETYIPSLNDLVPLLNQIKILNIEIKSDGLFKDHDILKPLMKFLDKYKIDDKCIVSSFNPLILMKLR